MLFRFEERASELEITCAPRSAVRIESNEMATGPRLRKCREQAPVAMTDFHNHRMRRELLQHLAHRLRQEF